MIMKMFFVKSLFLNVTLILYSRVKNPYCKFAINNYILK